MPIAPVTSWTDAVMTSLAAALAILLGAIPKIIGFAVIVIIGWLLASAVAAAVASILRAVKFNDLAQRGGFADFVHKMGIRQDSAGFVANLAKWFIRLIALVSAFDALGLPRSYDTGLVATFRDRAALEAYTVHPEHILVADMGRHISEHVASVDFVDED